IPGNLISFNGVIRPDTAATTTMATATILATEIPGSVSTPTNFPVILGAKCTGLSSNPVNFVINPPLTLTPATLPNGAVGSPYIRTISASGGTSPYGTPFLPTAGSPPPFTASPGAFSMNFTPASATTYNWLLSQTDSGGGSVTAGYSFRIDQPSSVAASQ